jgi:predicted amidohydrolase
VTGPTTRIAVLQMTSGINPEANARDLTSAISEAAQGGAAMLFTPEMSGLLDRNRERARPHVVVEEESVALSAVRAEAARTGLWVALGSLAVLRSDGRWANRSFVIDAAGEIVARYDKIHMFDVELASGESWRESAAYAPGDEVVTADTPVGRLGLSVCYDIRFPALFEALGRKGLQVKRTGTCSSVPARSKRARGSSVRHKAASTPTGGALMAIRW